MQSALSYLHTPMPFGAVNLSRRVVAAARPLLRAGRSVESILNHYRSAATRGGLLLAEPAAIAGPGSPGPGICADSEMCLWRRVVNEVHDKEGRIILPLRHTGMATEEIPALIAAFLCGARSAKAVGFDGIEIQADGGCLLDQCVRKLLEIIEAVYSVWGKGRVGIRLRSHDHVPLLALANGMNRFERPFLHLVGEGTPPDELRRAFQGAIIVAADVDGDTAEAMIAARRADLVRFDRFLCPQPG